ncbi:probable L-ascorbate peroxidase 8, chloroplastic [Panicum virgatum]|uniref:probable L-ascorbate peroxidase 8, chloroplastic n=1 Tax=Panicum virgatum TaxID=38727 RepID=UPI0019D56854|nr:probable L-ascorbate peroxidase 8, chloroplastic [Panicum virgatum]
MESRKGSSSSSPADYEYYIHYTECARRVVTVRTGIGLSRQQLGGLHKLIQPIKDKYPGITYTDLFQLASTTAIEEAGGPKIPMKYGRMDVTAPEQCPPEGRLPDAGPRDPAEHLREVFYRMDLDDKEIVALSGAHTLGRARPDRSGWGKPETKYTNNQAGEADHFGGCSSGVAMSLLKMHKPQGNAYTSFSR